MGPKRLVRILKSMDRRLRWVWSPGKVSGLYFWQPKHPDAHENGLRHIGAIASPSWFFSLPKKDFYTNGKQHLGVDQMHVGINLDAWEYHRGWKSTVKLLGDGGHFDKSKLARRFGWDVLVPGLAGTLSRLPGWGELTKGQKAKQALGMQI